MRSDLSNTGMLDPALIDQPGEHLGRAIAGVGRQTRRRDLEPVGGALNHCLGRRDFRLPYAVVASTSMITACLRSIR